MDGRQDCRRKHDPAERDRDFRDDCDAGDPFRHIHGQLDKAMLPGDRDCFRERLGRAGHIPRVNNYQKNRSQINY